MKILTVFKSKGGSAWFIRIRNKRNGKIVADGAEGYASRSNAIRAAHNNWADGYDLEKISEHDDQITYKMVPNAAPPTT